MDAFGWDSVEARSEVGGNRGGGSLFLKIEDRKDVEVVFIGDPVVVQTCFVDGRSQAFTPELAARGEKPSNRVKVNVWNLGTNDVQIWETSLTTFKMVITVRRKLGAEAFGRKVFSIMRQGVGKDTRYTVMPMQDLSESQVQTLRTLTPHPLTESAVKEESSEKPKVGSDVAEPVPGDVQKCLELANDSPRLHVMEALSAFGLSSLKEVNPSNAGGVIARLYQKRVGF